MNPVGRMETVEACAPKAPNPMNGLLGELVL